jgi:hypothetical protein
MCLLPTSKKHHGERGDRHLDAAMDTHFRQLLFIHGWVRNAPEFGTDMAHVEELVERDAIANRRISGPTDSPRVILEQHAPRCSGLAKLSATIRRSMSPRSNISSALISGEGT